AWSQGLSPARKLRCRPFAPYRIPAREDRHERPYNNTPLEPLSSGLLGSAFASSFSSGGSSRSGLLSALFSTFLGLLTRHALVRVAAGRTLDNASGVQEAQNAVGRLGALGDPFLGL